MRIPGPFDLARVCLLAAALCVPMPLLAQADIQTQAGSADVARLHAFVSTDFYRNLVRRALADVPAAVLPRCPALHAAPSRVTLLRPPAFAPDGFPTAGAWHESLPVFGCGNDTRINLFFRATTAEKVDTLIGVPGDTHAGLALQHDAITEADAAAVAVLGNCSHLDVLATRYDGADPPESQSTRLPWREGWTLGGCGRRAAVAMQFLPDATGTRIVAHVAARP